MRYLPEAESHALERALEGTAARLESADGEDVARTPGRKLMRQTWPRPIVMDASTPRKSEQNASPLPVVTLRNAMNSPFRCA
jgi:hypothetical protein